MTQANNHVNQPSPLCGAEALEALPLVPATEFFSPMEENAQAPTEPHTDEPGHDLEDRELRLLEAIVAQPLLPSSKYPKLAGMSSKTAVQVRKALVARALIRERRLDRQGPGRSSILLEPTDAAVRIVSPRTQSSEVI